MAVTFKNSGRINPKTFGIPSTDDKITLSAYVRINSLPTNLPQSMFGRGNAWFSATGTAGGSTFYFGASSYTTSGTLYTAAKYGASVGTVYHLIFVFDKNDPSRQFFAVNGAKTPWPGTGGLRAANSIGYGSNSNDFTIQQVFYIDGYAATDDEVLALADDVGAAFGMFSTAAAIPGVRAMYHSLEGTIGADVHAGDPGFSWGGDPNYGIAEPSRPSAADSVRYVEAMTCSSATTIQRAYIGSSGKTLTIIMADSSGTSRITPQGTSLALPLSIRIDAGPSIALPTTAETGAYVQPTADAMFFRLPDGFTVSPGQQVLLDAPAGWLIPRFGHCPVINGAEVGNYAGMPISDGLWPNAAPTRVGTNSGLYSPVTYPSSLINRNRALNFGYGSDLRWPDGTIKGNLKNRMFAVSGSPNSVDLSGIAGKEGLWVIRWDDYDHSNPVNITLSGADAASVVEAVAYRNNGDDHGKGKAKVYDVRFGAPSTYTLRTNIDATTTTIPYIEANAYALSGGYLTIDGEQIQLGTRNTSAKQYEGCTRGWNNTIAAPHTAGASITGRLPQKHGTIFISISSPNETETHYVNLAAYDPESWDIPATPGPVSIPPPNAMEFDPALRSYLEPGAGALRHMNVTPSMAVDIDEPEQLATPDQPHFADRKFIEKFHLASVRPFDPVASPYYYTPAPWPSSETYPAELGSPITTAPPPGTIETIKITNGRATPVIRGQQLFVGQEVMRVIGVPRSGDDYSVERGSLNTPTSAHPAGPITVGYRIPITQSSQYTPPDPAIIHHYEAFFDESLSSPIEFGRNLANRFDPGWGGTDDANLTARRALTLKSPLSPTSLVVNASPTAPGDWDFIARNMKLVIGSEALVVDSVDPGGETIVVKSRPATAASYPTGTTATTRSSGVLLQSPDGTKKAYNFPYNLKSLMLPTGVNRALITTTDDTGTVRTPSTAFSVQLFDSPNAGTQEVVSPAGYFSYELTAKQTALAPEAWHWLNLPARATDATVYAATKAVRDNLPAGRKVLFELSNENWNWTFSNATSMYVLASVCRLASHKEAYIMRSQSAFEVAKRCFAEVGRENEIVHVICWQTQSEILSDCRRLGVQADALAVAPYLYPPSTADFGSVFNAIDNDQACDLYTFQTLYELSSEQYRKIAETTVKSIETHAQITGKRPLMTYYEGGLEVIVGRNTPGVVDPGGRRQRDIINNPNFYFTERDFYAAVRELGRVDLYMQFCLSWPASWDAGRDRVNFWGLLRGVAQKPGYGDGRDGGVDNRLYPFVDPPDLTKGGDVYCESVRMQAWLDHQKAFIAAQAANPVDPDPDDPAPTDPGTNPNTPTTSFAKPARFVISRFRPRFG